MPKPRNVGGGTSGFGYADPAKKVEVQSHQYRLGVIVGIQPERAGRCWTIPAAGRRSGSSGAHNGPSGRPISALNPGPLPWRRLRTRYGTATGSLSTCTRTFTPRWIRRTLSWLRGTLTPKTGTGSTPGKAWRR